MENSESNKERRINTSGGSYIEGDAHTVSGDFVLRDKIINNYLDSISLRDYTFQIKNRHSYNDVRKITRKWISKNRKANRNIVKSLKLPNGALRLIYCPLYVYRGQFQFPFERKVQQDSISTDDSSNVGKPRWTYEKGVSAPKQVALVDVLERKFLYSWMEEDNAKLLLNAVDSINAFSVSFMWSGLKIWQILGKLLFGMRKRLRYMFLDFLGLDLMKAKNWINNISVEPGSPNIDDSLIIIPPQIENRFIFQARAVVQRKLADYTNWSLGNMRLVGIPTYYGERVNFIVYPFWLIQPEYDGQSLTIVIDGHQGKILFSILPPSLITKLFYSFFGFLISSIILIIATILIGILVYFLRTFG